MRRLLSFALALAMMSPVLASAVEAAIGTWLAPEPGKPVTGSRAEVAVGFNTQSDLRVTALELYVDGKFYSRKRLAEPASRGVCSLWWDISKAAPGSHDLAVKIFAGEQMISKVSGTGVVGGGAGSILDISPPVVVFENIKSGDVLKGKAPIKITAVDDSGKAPMVSLLVNDMLKMLRNTPPYSYDLDTTTYPDGDHKLTTYAYDQSGNRSEPAVVKVVFSNGVKRPIVAAMTATQDPTPAAVRPAEVTPPAVSADPSSTAKSAGRVPSAEPAPKAAEPAARQPVKQEQRVSTVKASPAVSAAAAPATSAPENVTAAEGSRHSLAAAEMNGSSILVARAASPRPLADPLPSVTAMVDTSARPKSADPIYGASRAESFAVAEPDSERVAVVAAVPVAAPALDTTVVLNETTKVMGFSAEIPEDLVPNSLAAPVTDLIIAGDTRELESVEADYTALENLTPTAPEEPAAIAEPKPVQTAMVTDIGPNRNKSSVHQPPAMKKDAKARKEEQMSVKPGKVKARTLFEGMGGVLFWHSATKTVTVYLDGMTLEMRIGKKTAMVNGTEMKIDMAPYIVNGRTIIDASVYNQACALTEHAKLIRQA